MWILGISSLCVSQVSEIIELEQNDFSILNNEFHLNLVWSHSFILIFLQCIDLSTQRRPRPGLACVAQHFWAGSVLGCCLTLTCSQPADLAQERQGYLPLLCWGRGGELTLDQRGKGGSETLLCCGLSSFLWVHVCRANSHAGRGSLAAPQASSLALIFFFSFLPTPPPPFFFLALIF